MYPNNNNYQVPFLKGRPVTSLEEVKASQIDFDGSIFIFPDLTNHKIYTKQIAIDGTANLNVYELGKLPAQNEYLTKEEFRKTMEQLKTALEKKNEDNKFSFDF